MKNNLAKALLYLFADRGIYISKSQWKTLLGALAQGLRTKNSKFWQVWSCHVAHRSFGL
jgi:hypothetical protein